jgi:hypothetical protein
MADFDDILTHWQASLSPRVPRAAVAQFLSQDGAALREAFEHASRTARERRSARAFHGWLDRQALAGRDFDDAQLHWLDMMRQDIAATGELSFDRFNRGPFLARGGEDKAVRLFGRRTLGEVVASLNATLASKATACGGTCGVKAGGCGCGCSGAGKPKSVETAGSTTLEAGEYEAWMRRFEDELIELGIPSAEAPSLARRLSDETLRLYRKTAVDTDLYRLLVTEFVWLAERDLDAAAIRRIASTALDLTMGREVEP